MSKQWFWMALCFGLMACGEREGLAPVVELKWHAVNAHAKTHRVVRGETLYAVAFRYDQDYRQLALMNHLQSPYTLRVGQVLRLQSLSTQIPIQQARSPSSWGVSPSVPYHRGPTAWVLPARGRIVATYAPQQGKKGIDIAGKKGEKIHAAANGVVAYAGNGLLGYGNLIIIKHDNQYLTAYGNNSTNLVREGQRIRAGEVIANMGVVDRRYWGVHFEIRRAGKPVNPLNYFSVHEGGSDSWPSH